MDFGQEQVIETRQRYTDGQRFRHRGEVISIVTAQAVRKRFMGFPPFFIEIIIQDLSKAFRAGLIL